MAEKEKMLDGRGFRFGQVPWYWDEVGLGW